MVPRACVAGLSFVTGPGAHPGSMAASGTTMSVTEELIPSECTSTLGSCRLGVSQETRSCGNWLGGPHHTVECGGLRTTLLQFHLELLWGGDKLVPIIRVFPHLMGDREDRRPCRGLRLVFRIPRF